MGMHPTGGVKLVGPRHEIIRAPAWIFFFFFGEWTPAWTWFFRRLVHVFWVCRLSHRAISFIQIQCAYFTNRTVIQPESSGGLVDHHVAYHRLKPLLLNPVYTQLIGTCHYSHWNSDSVSLSRSLSLSLSLSPQFALALYLFSVVHSSIIGRSLQDLSSDPALSVPQLQSLKAIRVILLPTLVNTETHNYSILWSMIELVLFTGCTMGTIFFFFVSLGNVA